MSADTSSHASAPFQPDSAAQDDPTTARAALADHRFAVECWLKSTPAERPHHWRAVEAAWRRCKQLGADTEASKQSAALMRAGGKLRSIA